MTATNRSKKKKKNTASLLGSFPAALVVVILSRLLPCPRWMHSIFSARAVASAFVLSVSTRNSATAAGTAAAPATGVGVGVGVGVLHKKPGLHNAVLLSSKVNGEEGEEEGAAASSNDDDAREIDRREKKVPQTGWNHNLPSKSSGFWQSSDSSSASSGEVPSRRSASSEGNTLRTGWLHNTEPAGRQDATTAKSSGADNGGPSSNAARQRLELAMKRQERNHRIDAVTFHACGGADSGSVAVVTEHRLSVPLEHGVSADKPTMAKDRVDLFFTVVEMCSTPETERFFRELASSSSPQQRAQAYVDKSALANADKLLLYLQGGPGFGAPTPMVGLGFGSPDASWGAKALSMSSSFERVVLMDQRGTGKSSPLTKQYLEKAFPDLFLLDGKEGEAGASSTSTLQDFKASHPEESERVQSAVEQATNFLSHFRADMIVRDAEIIRDCLLQPFEADQEKRPARPWGCALGQSFGGFCLMSYLSLVEEPPQVVLFTGGIAPMLTPVYDVYTKLWDVVKERNLRYYDMYPGDVALVKKIVRKLLNDPPRLPSGGTLTARRFLQLGLGLGGSPSSFASIHAMLGSAFLHTDNDDEDETELEFTRAFLQNIEIQQSFDNHPIYYWLHEPIYADGSFNGATEWASHRSYLDKIKVAPEFDYKRTCSTSEEHPVLFFGEMVFPWMSEDYAELRGVGLSAVANALAKKTDWGPLFDAAKMRSALVDGKCKAAAAIYHEDMYVEFDACMKVIARGGPLEKCKPYVTNEFQHSGLRDDGAKIFAKLFGMATGGIRTPS